MASHCVVTIASVAILLQILFPLEVCEMSSASYGAAAMEESDSLIPECPDTPNCVSSLSKNPGRKVDPFPMIGSVSRSLDRLEEIVRSMPRTKIVSRSDRMLKAEFRTRLGFVDDVIFLFSEDEGVIHVWSASRTGSWDLGVNRRRVKRIRSRY